jgi:hypothetical protein
VRIENISAFVAEQRAHVEKKQLQKLVTPEEHVYDVKNPDLARKVCVSETK